MITVTLKKADPELADKARNKNSVLAPFEYDRFQSMHADNQAAFVTARSMLRTMLGKLLGVEAALVPLHQEGAGRVTLNQSPETPHNIFFSVSHTGIGSNAHVAVAVSDQPIGIDLDDVTRRIDWQRIVDRHFHPANRAYLATLSGNKATQGFFRYWTLIEAMVKLEDGKLLPYLHGCEIKLNKLGGELVGPGPEGAANIGLRANYFASEGLMFGLAVKGGFENMDIVTELPYE